MYLVTVFFGFVSMFWDTSLQPNTTKHVDNLTLTSTASFRWYETVPTLSSKISYLPAASRKSVVSKSSALICTYKRGGQN